MIVKALAPAACAALVAACVAGCSHPPQPSPATTRASPTAMVDAIRAARTRDKSVVEVTPLRDPSVDGFLDQARSDEAARKYSDALAKVDAALKLSPDAPDILQYRAEIEVLLHDYPAAAADAHRSWTLGSKVGGLCASNWQTVLEIDQSKNDAAGMAAARTARDACHKPGPTRL